MGQLLMLGYFETEHHGGWGGRGVCSVHGRWELLTREQDQRQNTLQTHPPLRELVPLTRAHF